MAFLQRPELPGSAAFFLIVATRFPPEELKHFFGARKRGPAG